MLSPESVLRFTIFLSAGLLASAPLTRAADPTPPPPAPDATRAPTFSFTGLPGSTPEPTPVPPATPPPAASAAATAPPVAAPASAPVSTPPPAHAAIPIVPNPLDATPQEIARLYGPVLKHNARVRNHQVLEGGTILDGDLHGHNGLVIRAVYHEGRTVLLEYTRIGGVLTVVDANLLLATAAGDGAWVPGSANTADTKYFRRSDGRAIASYVAANDGSLLIAAEGPEHEKFFDAIGH